MARGRGRALPVGVLKNTVLRARGGKGLSDGFASLDNFTVQPGGGSVTVVDGKLRINGNGVNGNDPRAWLSALRIPPEWTTIQITVKGRLSALANADMNLGLCFDEPPTGSPSSFGGNPMANGYSFFFTTSGNDERVARNHGYAIDVLRQAQDCAADTTEREISVRLTKNPGNVTIERWFNGVALPAVVDSNANRKTGACYVGLSGWSSGGQFVDYDDLVVSWA